MLPLSPLNTPGFLPPLPYLFAPAACLSFCARPKQQRLLVVSFVILHAAQQLTGINAIFYYSNSFFVGIIDNPLVGTTLVGVVNVVATYVALQLMDKTGRVSAWRSTSFSIFILMLSRYVHDM